MTGSGMTGTGVEPGRAGVDLSSPTTAAGASPGTAACAQGARDQTIGNRGIGRLIRLGRRGSVRRSAEAERAIPESDSRRAGGSASGRGPRRLAWYSGPGSIGWLLVDVEIRRQRPDRRLDPRLPEPRGGSPIMSHSSMCPEARIRSAKSKLNSRWR